VLFEDDEPIGPAHSAHADIRERGRGRYSHWQETVHFAPSRNDDARAHAYTYALHDLRASANGPLRVPKRPKRGAACDGRYER
jgi:pectate lyase